MSARTRGELLDEVLVDVASASARALEAGEPELASALRAMAAIVAKTRAASRASPEEFLAHHEIGEHRVIGGVKFTLLAIEPPYARVRGEHGSQDFLTPLEKWP